MNLTELPECPVCLQPFDGESTTPRVLPCGHSACETCLTQLPKPFPNAVRCPACTQLVKYPHPQGPSALPKNIDLLRLSSLLTATNSYNSPKPTKSITQLTQDFIPNLWSHEFYSKWKDWVVPSDAVYIESGAAIEDGFRLYGRIGSLGEGLLGMPIRCFMKEKQKVSLLKVGLFSCGDDSGFSYSYVAKIMWVLFGMRDGQRDELGLILRGSLRGGRICPAYGFWYNEVDKSVYLVCERYNWSSFNKLKHEPGCVDEEIENDVYGFTMIDMEICDAVSGLHKEGLVIGCLGLSCFDIDEFGHVYIDFNEVLMMGERILRMIAEAVLSTRKSDGKEFEMKPEDEILKTQMFVSPELLLEMLQKMGIDMGPGNLRSAVGYGSDVWSLACVLIWHLVGKPFIDHMNSYLCSLAHLATDKNDSDLKGFYMCWLEKVNILLDSRLCSEGSSMKDFLRKCLDLDPERRPSVQDVWKCIRGLIIKPRANVVVSSEKEIARVKNGHCILLGELCLLLKGTSRISEKLTMDDEKEDESGRAGEKVEELMVKRDIIEGISSGHLKCIDLKGHLDCITGLAIGGGFLFSSSFDKTVNVWSVQDFSHVHSFKGHEHRIMAIVFANEEQPLCITGDNGGGICIWSIKVPFEEEPMKKLYQQKDWRYSGIHALAISGTGYFYTGSGDRSIKAWSMQDYTLSCTMTGHKSVVSALAVCNGVLYSGSWDGTIRLWCLSDHSHLTVLGEEIPGNVTSGSVLSLAADSHSLIAAHENGCIKELLHDESPADVIQIGSMTCDAVIIALIYWEGKLYVGRADKLIKLAAKTAEFRCRLVQGETIADIQAEAFAVVREAARRKLGMRHFDVQIIGGAVLNDGSIAEMKTGEGKTLVSTLAAYLNALTGEGVHVVTVNYYLAQRDAEWMGRVHRFLGLSVGLIKGGMRAEERRSNYQCDITYTNNSELGFDYLRDNLAGSSGQLVMRWPKPFHFAIVDEVDSVLIDEGRNPLLISGEASKDAAISSCRQSS